MMSKPKVIDARQGDLFNVRLSHILNPEHPLIKLAQLIDWASLEAYFSELYLHETRHPPLPIRLIIGLMMLQHVRGLSDDKAVEAFGENHYVQYFCGYDHIQGVAPLHPSSLSRWHQRIGPEGMEKILEVTIHAGKNCGALDAKRCSKVIVDTTVMEKAVSFPTDSKLLNRSREQLVSLAKKMKINLRQSDTYVGKRSFEMACRYGHAGQYRRMNKEIQKLKVYLVRVVRDVERKVTSTARPFFEDALRKAKKLMTQDKSTKHKLYSLHREEVECIAKGKAHKKYGLGCKVSLVVTHKEGFCLASQAMHEYPYDGHTLKGALDCAERLSGAKIKEVFVDQGYRKHGIEDREVFLSRQRGLPARLKRDLKRRSAIEPHIGHMKADGKLGRNYLKGKAGDRINALLSAVGHNLRLILNYLRKLFAPFVYGLLESLFFFTAVFFSF